MKRACFFVVINVITFLNKQGFGGETFFVDTFHAGPPCDLSEFTTKSVPDTFNADVWEIIPNAVLPKYIPLPSFNIEKTLGISSPCFKQNYQPKRIWVVGSTQFVKVFIDIAHDDQTPLDLLRKVYPYEGASYTTICPDFSLFSGPAIFLTKTHQPDTKFLKFCYFRGLLPQPAVKAIARHFSPTFFHFLVEPDFVKELVIHSPCWKKTASSTADLLWSYVKLIDSLKFLKSTVGKLNFSLEIMGILQHILFNYVESQNQHPMHHLASYVLVHFHEKLKKFFYRNLGELSTQVEKFEEIEKSISCLSKRVLNYSVATLPFIQQSFEKKSHYPNNIDVLFSGQKINLKNPAKKRKKICPIKESSIQVVPTVHCNQIIDTDFIDIEN